MRISSSSSSTYGKWEVDDGNQSSSVGFICEWETNNHVATAAVPDLNASGKPEIAALYLDFATGYHTVRVRDMVTGSLLRTLTFLKSEQPPQGLAVVRDLSGNTVPEIGVLYRDPTTLQPTVWFKDATTLATVKTMAFLSNLYDPKAINTLGDLNANGSDEILVEGVLRSTGAAYAEIRDSKTGAKLGGAAF
ncbi:MAG: hypothetical protein ACKN9T_07060 [Candidatus Methylumidiphilus sp.]